MAHPQHLIPQVLQTETQLFEPVPTTEGFLGFLKAQEAITVATGETVGADIKIGGEPLAKTMERVARRAEAL